MTEPTHLAETLNGFVAQPGLFWFPSFVDATAGLNAQQAASVPAARFNSVWAVTLHLTLCQRFALAILSGKADAESIFADGAWPAPRDPESQAAWQEAKADLLEVNRAFSACVAALPPETMETELAPVGMKRFQYIQGHLAHNSYHLCEIVSVRHMLGLWLENT